MNATEDAGNDVGTVRQNKTINKRCDDVDFVYC